MGREPEKTDCLTPEERRAYSRRLRELADAIDMFHDVTGHESNGYVFRKPSLVDGVRRIEAFGSDLRKTINQVIAGKPLRKNSRKQDLVG